MLSVARSLEEGRYDGAIARGLALAWGPVSARGVVRSLPVPPHVRVVAVGGATLGGSGKTPLAIACARELARTGARVAFVGHAFAAHPRHARTVSPADSLAEVGDEALLAARALEAHGVRVVVAPSRGLAVALAARGADVLVLDGVLQLRPTRASLSLLAVDADEPWGCAEAVPPCGDLRAPIAALVAAADLVVRVGEHSPDTTVTSAGAYVGHTLLSWDALRPMRLGLACALARPRRLLRFLARRGITPVVTAFAQDHHPVPAAALRHAVDLWLATAKCAQHIPGTGAPLATLDYDVLCSPTLVARLSAQAP